MLVLTRKPGQLLKITPHESLNLLAPVGELFEAGPMEVVVVRIEGSQVRLGIRAHSGLLILRDELVQERAALVSGRRARGVG